MTKTEWMTRQEAAEHFGVSLRTLKRWMDAGKLTFKRDPRNGRVSVLVVTVAGDAHKSALG